MQIQISSLQNEIFNPILNKTTKGFVDKDKLDNYKRNSYLTRIPVGLEYRPDLIARNFLGDETLSWLITCVNDFENGIRDYTPNRKIYIPNI